MSIDIIYAKVRCVNMNIIYISTVFPRENENSTIYTDLAEALVEHGHKVTAVVTEEKKKSGGTGITKERGCDVLRVKTGNMYDVTLIEKGISILLLENQIKKAINRYLKNERFDLILFESPPVTLSGVVKMAKEMYKSPAFLMMKDIFPQNAVDIGLMKKRSFIYKFFKLKEQKLYRVADIIGCMSEGNRQYLKKNSNVPYNKLTIFPNTKKIGPLPLKTLDIRDKYGIPRDKIVFVFGGNMGKPQGMDFLIQAIKKSREIENAFFVLVGRGTEKDKVKCALQGYENVLILDNLARVDYEKLVSSCDVGIVSLDYRFTVPNYPSRILSYMEYAMPVLAATDKNTDFRNLIEEAQCGYWCESKDPHVFMEYVRILCNREERDIMGENGREYMIKHYSTYRSVELLESIYK